MRVINKFRLIKFFLSSIFISRFCLVFFICFNFNLANAAKITVSPLVLNLKDNGPGFADVTVYNTGDKKAYVKLDLYKIKNPGARLEKKIKEDIKNPMEFGLVASPLKMVIPVNQSRKVRLLPLLKHLKTESIYKLEVVPVEGELKIIDSDNNSNNKSDNKINAGVKITVGYGVRVSLLPDNINREVRIIKNTNNNYDLKNMGNVNVLITQAEVCDYKSNITQPKDWKNCKLLKSYSKRLYPGNLIKLTDDSEIKKYINSNNKFKILRFKGYFDSEIFYIGF